MSDNPVKVTFVADPSEMDAAFNDFMAKLKQSSATLDTFNASAAKAFMEGAKQARALNQELGATQAQLQQIDDVTEQVGQRAKVTGDRMANAFERAARGVSVMTYHSGLQVRSFDQIIASAADIAFAFGPEGAIVSGITMVTAAIVFHAEMAEQRMRDLADKYAEHVADLVSNSGLEEIAKRSADAYIHELEAQSKLVRDKQAGSMAEIFGGLMNPQKSFLDAVLARFRTGGEERDAATANTEREAAERAKRIVASIDGSQKDLEKLQHERERLNADIARAEEHMRGLDKDKNEHEIAETEQRLSRARHRLQDVESLTGQLERDRQARLKAAYSDALNKNDPVLAGAIQERSRRYTTSDFAAEHSQREEGVSLSGSGSAGRKQDQRDATAQRERDQALEREARGMEMLQEVEDQVLERHLRALDMKEAADIMAAEREFKLMAARINNMKISEDLKTELMVAAQEDRNEKMADVLNKSADESVKAAIKALDKQLKAEEKARNARARVIESVEKGIAHAIVAHHKDMGREILRALLEPEVKHLEALGAKQFTIAAADAATGNFGGAAEHAAAGAAYLAGATLVASIGGAGGGGGGHGGGGGGGGHFNAADLGARGGVGGDQTIKIEIVNVTKDQNGREVARTRQMIQRLEDQNMPIRVAL